jgi:hypothetical protein
MPRAFERAESIIFVIMLEPAMKLSKSLMSWSFFKMEGRAMLEPFASSSLNTLWWSVRFYLVFRGCNIKSGWMQGTYFQDFVSVVGAINHTSMIPYRFIIAA